MRTPNLHMVPNSASHHEQEISQVVGLEWTEQGRRILAGVGEGGGTSTQIRHWKSSPKHCF